MLRPHDPIPGRTLRAVGELTSAFSKGSDLENITITGVSIDSHQIEAGDLFVAVAGAKVHGATYAGNAKLNGAVAVLTDEVGAALITDLPVLVVADPRATAGVIAAWLHNEPMRDMFSVGVTGTNGKTTTVEMAAAMLRASGISAIACGNVGLTVIESVESLEKYEVLVIELSSFQLHWMYEATFVAVAILNIAQDHVDWHGGFEEYAQAKMSILDRASTGIFNGDDAQVVSRAAHWQGRKIFFSLDTPGPGEIGVVEELLVDRAFVSDPQEAAMIAEVVDVTPTVPHNVANALAAAGLARAVGVSHKAIQLALKEFKPGRHRIENIFSQDDINWIDDSKATNPHAAAASLLATLSAIWIAGGLAKGAEMAELIARCKSRIKVAILIGTDRELIAAQLRAQAPHVELVLVDAPAAYSRGGDDNSLMAEVVKAAKERAVAGDTVLLAPACASMDQFLSYADRGDRFARAVLKEHA
jgi:UDP-N-acetylmuramoylalanine--D-glutamate ligase